MRAWREALRLLWSGRGGPIVIDTASPDAQVRAVTVFRPTGDLLQRLMISDAPGALGQVASVMAEHQPQVRAQVAASQARITAMLRLPGLLAVGLVRLYAAGEGVFLLVKGARSTAGERAGYAQALQALWEQPLDGGVLWAVLWPALWHLGRPALFSLVVAALGRLVRAVLESYVRDRLQRVLSAVG